MSEIKIKNGQGIPLTLSVKEYDELPDRFGRRYNSHRVPLKRKVAQQAPGKWFIYEGIETKQEYYKLANMFYRLRSKRDKFFERIMNSTYGIDKWRLLVEKDITTLSIASKIEVRLL